MRPQVVRLWSVATATPVLAREPPWRPLLPQRMRCGGTPPAGGAQGARQDAGRTQAGRREHPGAASKLQGCPEQRPCQRLGRSLRGPGGTLGSWGWAVHAAGGGHALGSVSHREEPWLLEEGGRAGGAAGGQEAMAGAPVPRQPWPHAHSRPLRPSRALQCPVPSCAPSRIPCLVPCRGRCLAAWAWPRGLGAQAPHWAALLGSPDVLRPPAPRVHGARVPCQARAPEAPRHPKKGPPGSGWERGRWCHPDRFHAATWGLTPTLCARERGPEAAQRAPDTSSCVSPGPLVCVRRGNIPGAGEAV